MICPTTPPSPVRACNCYVRPHRHQSSNIAKPTALWSTHPRTLMRPCLVSISTLIADIELVAAFDHFFLWEPAQHLWKGQWEITENMSWYSRSAEQLFFDFIIWQLRVWYSAEMNPARPQLGIFFYFQGNSNSILEDFEKLWGTLKDFARL